MDLVQNNPFSYSGPNPVNMGHLITISESKKTNWNYIGPQNGLFGHEIVLRGPLQVPRKFQKEVSDIDLVNIRQLAILSFHSPNVRLMSDLTS